MTFRFCIILSIGKQGEFMMSYTMYLDDKANPTNNYDVIVRSYAEAVEWVLKNGIPSFISFDNDLEDSKEGQNIYTGYDFAKWIVKMAFEEALHFPSNFSFDVHCGDAVARNNINAILNNYLHFNLIYREC